MHALQCFTHTYIYLYIYRYIYYDKTTQDPYYWYHSLLQGSLMNKQVPVKHPCRTLVDKYYMDTLVTHDMTTTHPSTTHGYIFLFTLEPLHCTNHWNCTQLAFVIPIIPIFLTVIVPIYLGIDTKPHIHCTRLCLERFFHLYGLIQSTYEWIIPCQVNCGMESNYISIPKRERLNNWSSGMYK